MEKFSQPGCSAAWKEPWAKGASVFASGLVVAICCAGAEPHEGSTAQ